MGHRLGSIVLATSGVCAAASGGAAESTLAELDRLGRSIAAERCPRPQEMKVSLVRHPHAQAVADEMQSTRCRGFRVAVYRSHSSDPPRELPMSVVVESDHPRVDAAWSVGASSAEVRSALGAPFVTRGESFSYSLSPLRPGRDTLEFEVQAGIVRAVTWNWQVD